jgi:cation diffusion facilitator CzcD-associated flavoprotein CzcO
MFSRKKKEAPASSLSVCLVGCGPAGMSLLHALAVKKAKADPGSDEAKRLPNVTCYERAPNPGGLWRDISEEERNARNENKVVM